MTYDFIPDDELITISESDAAGIPREAVVASQRFLAEKLLEAQRALADLLDNPS